MTCSRSGRSCSNEPGRPRRWTEPKTNTNGLTCDSMAWNTLPGPDWPSTFEHGTMTRTKNSYDVLPIEPEVRTGRLQVFFVVQVFGKEQKRYQKPTAWNQKWAGETTANTEGAGWRCRCWIGDRRSGTVWGTTIKSKLGLRNGDLRNGDLIFQER